MLAAHWQTMAQAEQRTGVGVVRWMEVVRKWEALSSLLVVEQLRKAEEGLRIQRVVGSRELELVSMEPRSRRVLGWQSHCST